MKLKLFVMLANLGYRERERQRKRESRRQASEAQREKERERAKQRMRNFTGKQRETEQEKIEKGGGILPWSNGKKSGRELEKIDAGLATSGEEVSEKQQEKTGAAQT